MCEEPLVGDEAISNTMRGLLNYFEIASQARNTCTPFGPRARRGETAWHKCRCDI